MSISVCMATYNGEKYVARQLVSILDQLAVEDEIIVVDDCSRDGTVDIIRSLGDKRIALHVNDRNRGEVFSFSRAMSLARNDVVFLSDQDDIWAPGRAALMRRQLEASGAAVVTTNFEWINAEEAPIRVAFDGVSADQSQQHLSNIVEIFLGKTNYFGCAMALRRDFLKVVTPIPAYVESHDLWIALASNLAASNVHLNESTLLKRRHDNNTTSTVSTRPLHRKLWSRVIFIRSLVTLFARRRHLSAHQAH